MAIFYNPDSQFHVGTVFGVLGIGIYSGLLCLGLVQSSCQEGRKLHILRVVIKATLFTLMHYSPVPLFAAAAIIDLLFIIQQYRSTPDGHWVWVSNHVLCLVSCGALVWMNNSMLGMGTSALAMSTVLVGDGYLHWWEYKMAEMERVKLRQVHDKSGSV